MGNLLVVESYETAGIVVVTCSVWDLKCLVVFFES